MQLATRVWVAVLLVTLIARFGSEPLDAQSTKPSSKSTKKESGTSKTTTNPGAASFVKACKAATALVNRHEAGSGSAFCVSSEGVFLTNRHVVEGLEPGATVELVLNAGEKTEQLLKAKLVHVSDNERVDLAILKTAPSKELNPLTFGNDTGLEETASVTAFGFPFGRSLAGAKQQFPNVTVTTGKISALRRQDDGLEVIQVDAAINPGCSGGPLVDRQGKVIGVVFAAVPRSGIAFAVPVSKVLEYVAAPHVVLSHPEIRYSDRHDKQRLEIEVVEIPSSNKPVTIELTIRGDNAALRTLPVQRKGNLFETSAEIFEKPVVASLLDLKIWQGRTSMIAQIADQPLRIGSTTLPLSACQVIQRRTDAHLVTTVEGDKFATSISDWPKAKLADETELDLSLADRIQIFAKDSADAEVAYDVTAKRGDTTIATASGVIRCTGRPRRTTEAYSDDDHSDEPPPDGVTIEALVDGKSSLMVTPEGMYWEHHTDAPPGSADGNRSFVLVNDRKWFLRWHKDFEGKSRTEPLLFKVGGLSHEIHLCSLRDQPTGHHNPGRGGIEVQQHPLGSEPTRITFNDSAAGAGLFRVHLRPKPEWKIPAAVSDRLKPPTSARWSFDDDLSNNIQDVTGNSHHGHGPIPTFVNGRVGKALALDIGNVNCGNIGDFERADAFSLGGWAYVTNTSVVHEIGARMDGRIGYRGYDLCVVADRLAFHLLHHFDSRNGVKVLSVETIKPFRWHHCFATYDGSGNSSGVRLYIDGAPAEFIVSLDGLTKTTKITAPFRIGMREPGSSGLEPMRGQLDEVRLYSRVLRPEEVRELALSQQPGVTAGESKSLRDQLVGAWSFDNVQRDNLPQEIVQDGSGNGNHGTVEFNHQNISFEPGKFGKAVRLNNRVIQFDAATGDFERTDAFSYGCWVRRTAKPNQSLFSKMEHRTPIRGYDLMIQKGKPTMRLDSVWEAGHDEPTRAIVVLGEETIAADEWHHVLVTYDGSSKAAGVTIYVDSNSIATKTAFDTLDGTIRTVTPLCLGNRFNDAGGVYDGMIDEAVIYARCLTPEEVRDLVSGKPPAP